METKKMFYTNLNLQDGLQVEVIFLRKANCLKRQR